MSHIRTAILVQHAVEISVPPFSPRNACSFCKSTHAVGLRIALIYTALILQRVLPVVCTVMPEMALVIVCLASECSALAGRIA